MTVAIKLFTTFFKSLAKCRYISSHRQKKPMFFLFLLMNNIKICIFFTGSDDYDCLVVLKCKKGKGRKKSKNWLRSNKVQLFICYFSSMTLNHILGWYLLWALYFNPGELRLDMILLIRSTSFDLSLRFPEIWLSRLANEGHNWEHATKNRKFWFLTFFATKPETEIEKHLADVSLQVMFWNC